MAEAMGDQLRELDLLDEPVGRDDRCRAVVDRRPEPFPGQDGGRRSGNRLLALEDQVTRMT
jgi:hypothetical protein